DAAAVAGLLQRARAIKTDQLRRDAGRRRPLRDQLHALARVAYFFFQLLARRDLGRIFFDQPGDPVDHARIDGRAVLLGENDFAVIGHRDDRDRFLCGLSLDVLPAVALENVYVFQLVLLKTRIAVPCAAGTRPPTSRNRVR